jgi:hypothetical protein
MSGGRDDKEGGGSVGRQGEVPALVGAVYMEASDLIKAFDHWWVPFEGIASHFPKRCP